MKVRVKLTEPIWRTVGTRDLVVEVPAEEAPVGDVLEQLASKFPRFGEEIFSGTGPGDYHYGLFLNDRMVNLENRGEVLARDGDEIFILLPVAGGTSRVRVWQ